MREVKIGEIWRNGNGDIYKVNENTNVTTRVHKPKYPFTAEHIYGEAMSYNVSRFGEYKAGYAGYLNLTEFIDPEENPEYYL